MIHLTIALRGVAPLVMHHRRMADPLDEWAKNLAILTGKRNKTEADHEAIARVEFEGGMYFEPEIGPYIPAENIHKCIVEGARFDKNGRGVERALVILDQSAPLVYDGPRTVQGLYDEGFDYRVPVGIGKSRTMRTRPKFNDWATAVSAVLDETMLDLDDLELAVRKAGDFVGLMERRPMFGRFDATVRTGKEGSRNGLHAERSAAVVAAAV